MSDVFEQINEPIRWRHFGGLERTRHLLLLSAPEDEGEDEDEEVEADAEAEVEAKGEQEAEPEKKRRPTNVRPVQLLMKTISRLRNKTNYRRALSGQSQHQRQSGTFRAATPMG